MNSPILGSPDKAAGDIEFVWNSRGSRNAWRHFYLPVGLIAILTATSVFLYSNQYGREWSASQDQISMLAQQQQQQHKLAAQISDLAADQLAVHNLVKEVETLVRSKCSSSQLQERNEPNTPTQPVATPAAVAAVPQLTTLHNAVLRSSQDFDNHRTVTQQLLDKLVHMEAAAAQQVSQAEAACSQLMHHAPTGGATPTCAVCIDQWRVLHLRELLVRVLIIVLMTAWCGLSPAPLAFPLHTLPGIM
jgi:hypothetical protein